MKDQERKALLEQLEDETKKRQTRQPRPLANSIGGGVGSEEVADAVKDATDAFRKALEAV